ncbi:MAG TPA: hypothetical protein VI636_18370 [Candidatus Angelobacter sp.]
MRLFENLRSAEQKGVKMMRQGMARARDEWGDVERRIRQRMRIYPQKSRQNVVAAAYSPVELHPDIPAQEPLATTETLRPIVSVHGRDIKDDELDHPAA